MKIKVPSIVCQGCVDTITKEIKTHEPEAKVEVDLEGKTVTVDETKASEESIKQMITAVGHTVE
ncbi:MAG: heavy-metal-associated domain-containing protein [Oscillatoria sp. PMC 1051.18]|uniref:heavy-metal-associated domain-containing protein n=1 Tax=Oscillatoria salina TaxID=331517 RepID=UPI0013BB6879|nr:heavy-metal-associated domain-containing protein [Oscillatoria salina]MBZ8183216.1 heavy-metal-associated domain-containing protein [Oscillatoria salina IIICB1]MEC4894022.1 heavy-metal-associated domain-containing protein [Oscillatoria sp. PMC 1050.18]MEC5032664.1 heavy-metal-associated domain-containing protein [Oscillatoria sp. PMC 1051.18]NET88547.1 heavy-metal-associated domain-containing protein [Kamptonema sp. SIO1D9]